MTYSFQWEKRDGSGNNPVDIPGATQATFTIPDDGSFLGHTVGLRVSDGASTVEAAPVGPVVAPPTGILGTIGQFLGSSYPHQTNVDSYPAFSVSGQNEGNAVAQHPSQRVLGYVPLFPFASSFSNHVEGGVSYSEIQGTDALLYTASHAEMTGSGYGQHIINPGSALYQSLFVNDWLGYMAHYGLDGAFLDNWIDSVTEMGLPVGYPFYNKAGAVVIADQAAWQNAMVAFAANVLDQIRGHGYYVLVNGASGLDNDGSLTQAWVHKYAAHVDAVSIEYLFANPSYTTPPHTGGAPVPTRSMGSAFYQHWDGWLAAAEYVQSQGPDLVCVMDVAVQPTNAQVARFTRASFIMAWDPGHPNSGWAWCANMNLNENIDFWLPGVSDIDTGLPTGPRTAVGACWRRQCANKLVYVNPTTSVQVADGHTIQALDALFL